MCWTLYFYYLCPILIILILIIMKTFPTCCHQWHSILFNKTLPSFLVKIWLQAQNLAIMLPSMVTF